MSVPIMPYVLILVKAKKALSHCWAFNWKTNRGKSINITLYQYHSYCNPIDTKRIKRVKMLLLQGHWTLYQDMHNILQSGHVTAPTIKLGINELPFSNQVWRAWGHYQWYLGEKMSNIWMSDILCFWAGISTAWKNTQVRYRLSFACKTGYQLLGGHRGTGWGILRLSDWIPEVGKKYR